MVETEPGKCWLCSHTFSVKKTAGRFDDADLWGDAAEDVSVFFSYVFLSLWMLLLICQTKTFLMQQRSLSHKLGQSKTKLQESTRKQEPTRPESRKIRIRLNSLLDYLTSLPQLEKSLMQLMMMRIMDLGYLKTRTKKMQNLKSQPKLLLSRLAADKLSICHHRDLLTQVSLSLVSWLQ